MPIRTVPLITEEIYHIVNRGVGQMPIFKNAHDYKRFIKTFQYYQHQNVPIKLSGFLKFSLADRQKNILRLDKTGSFLVKIIAFCLMPNHYHFLLKQSINDGILNFIRLTTNSYSKYFNTKYERKGSMFEGRFRAVRVESEEQLLHLSRYIHLNPYSGYLVKDFKAVFSYPYSSLSEYLNLSETAICQKETVRSYFKTPKAYKKFIVDRADYQRNLDLVKHKLLEQ